MTNDENWEAVKRLFDELRNLRGEIVTARRYKERLIGDDFRCLHICYGANGIYEIERPGPATMKALEAELDGEIDTKIGQCNALERRIAAIFEGVEQV